MKCNVPQISWHNRDPVLSIDFQTCLDGIRRLATAGSDTHLLIWTVTIKECGNVGVEFVADLTRHTKAVNVVRFSPNGEILASADDEAAIILWKQQSNSMHNLFTENESNKENWTALKVLRGHIEDVCDLCWSPDSNFLISGSVDNNAILWDIHKGRNVTMLSEAKGFVQGVAWDPLGTYWAALSSDRVLRIYNAANYKLLHKVQKAVLPNNSPEKPIKAERIFYDDTLKSFCRRLSFSPDGSILIVPSGIREESDGKFSNATYVFSRNNLNKPVLCLPTGDKFTLATRCCPVLFKLRGNDEQKTDENLFNLPYRVIYAVATQNSILLYDTQQTVPFAHISNVHYTRLTDLAWSPDGRILMASSTDGYCSFVVFAEGELGHLYKTTKQEETSQKEPTINAPDNEPESNMDWTLVLEPTTTLDNCPTKVTSSPPKAPQITPLKVPQTTPLATKIDENEAKKAPRRVQFITLAKKS